MKYLVDFTNSATQSEIDVWLQSNSAEIVDAFNKFEQTYLIESAEIPPVGGIVESVIVDDASTAIELLSSPTFELDTESENNWWKSVVFQNAFDTSVVDIFRRGAGYAVYLMDSGVDAQHEDFSESTVRNLYSHTGTAADLNGHGTALASIIAGKEAGITDAEIISVKIFEQGVPTQISHLVQALDAIATDYLANFVGKPVVVNMSWGINRNEYVENKIRVLLDLGLVVVAAAGNSGTTIDQITPAGMPEVTTVGSINTNLEPSNFSNYTGTSSISYTAGETNFSPGLDYWAPGEHIHAANITGGYANIAGTSASAAIMSAAIIYNLSNLGVEFGKTYSHPAGISSYIDGSAIATVTRSTFRDSIRFASSSNVFIPARILVDLTSQYSGCTNRVPYIAGLKHATLETPDTFFGAPLRWYRTSIVVSKGVAFHEVIADIAQVDSITIENLPEGLTFEGNTVHGMLTAEVGEQKFDVFNFPMTLARGDQVLNIEFQIIYVDRDLLTSEFDAEEYANLIVDSGLIVYATQCFRCAGQPTVPCDFTCNVCFLCPDGKTDAEICGPPC